MGFSLRGRGEKDVELSLQGKGEICRFCQGRGKKDVGSVEGEGKYVGSVEGEGKIEFPAFFSPAPGGRELEGGGK